MTRSARPSWRPRAAAGSSMNMRRRNRNADTRMVLDAVAKVEETLAAQRQPPPAAEDKRAGDVGLAIARRTVGRPKQTATAALDAPRARRSLAPIRKARASSRRFPGAGARSAPMAASTRPPGFASRRHPSPAARRSPPPIRGPRCAKRLRPRSRRASRRFSGITRSGGCAGESRRRSSSRWRWPNPPTLRLTGRGHNDDAVLSIRIADRNGRPPIRMTSTMR